MVGSIWFLNSATYLIKVDLETKPVANEIIESYLNKLNEYESYENCFQLESCAEEWMKSFNFISEKIYEKYALLDVN